MGDIVKRIWDKYLGDNSYGANLAKEATDEIGRLRHRVAELEANAKTLATANADNAHELQERIAELESALAKSASREAALVEKLKVAEGALVQISLATVDLSPPYRAAPSHVLVKVASAALAKIKEAS